MCSKVGEVLFLRRPFELLFFLLLNHLYTYSEIIVGWLSWLELADIMSFPAMAAIEYLRCSCCFNILCDKKKKEKCGKLLLIFHFWVIFIIILYFEPKETVLYVQKEIKWQW